MEAAAVRAVTTVAAITAVAAIGAVASSARRAALEPVRIVEMIQIERDRGGGRAKDHVPHVLQSVAVGGRVRIVRRAWREREGAQRSVEAERILSDRRARDHEGGAALGDHASWRGEAEAPQEAEQVERQRVRRRRSHDRRRQRPRRRR
eukprot:5684368-Prymnesium_polylepis.1